MSVPALRFKEFSNSWSEKKLCEISDIKTGPFGSTLHEADYVETGTPIITVEHLGEQGVVHKNLPLVSDEDKIRLKSYNLRQGDIVFSRVGSVDRSCLISAKENGWLFSGRLLRVRLTDVNFCSIFLNQIFKNETVKYRIRSVAVGQTMASLNTEILKNFSLVFPTSKPEQTKIANFLTTVDEKITHLTQKHDLLTQYKKGVMQQIFSQELRFKDDNGQDFPEWEEKEVGEVFKVTRGNVLAMPLVSESKTETHQFPVYSSQTKNMGLSGYYNEHLYENSITWTTDGANAGDVNYRDGKFYCTNVCGVLISDDGYANACIAAMINAVSRKYVSYVGNPKLMNGVMAKIAIEFPCVKEQTKIANFLNAIDDKITSVQTQLQAVKQYKQGLLQQMFV